MDYRIAYNSGNTLRNLLGNPKDKIEVEDKSGIYEISCGNCEKKYVGQTRRSIKTRYKEHIAHFRLNRPEKSSVAQHIFDTGHSMGPNSLRLAKSVSCNRELDCYESIFIRKNIDNLMNSDNGPIWNSALFDLLQKSVPHGRLLKHD